jgi:hypothetical protein
MRDHREHCVVRAQRFAGLSRESGLEIAGAYRASDHSGTHRDTRLYGGVHDRFRMAYEALIQG